MSSSQVGQRAAPGNSPITATAATATIRDRGQFQFYRKSRSGSSAFQNETRASTGLAVTSKERNPYLSQPLVGKDPVTADIEKYPSIVVQSCWKNRCGYVGGPRQQCRRERCRKRCHASAIQSVATDSSNKFTDSLRTQVADHDTFALRQRLAEANRRNQWFGMREHRTCSVDRKTHTERPFNGYRHFRSL